MASHILQSTIREGDQVILKKDKNIRVVQVHKTRLVWMEKVKFTLDAVIGQPFGGWYEVKGQKLVKVSRRTLCEKGGSFLNSVVT
ncbi:hypothetical protein NP493_1443g00010 [Ridgeia piscesae]|uniref:Uncharacterized protein n=1 Tax=Ridgeia piscesae TaxID=27915 RepID=A0AAD9K2T4_RIDPI|nr:hypothetical protein NP493_1443g00010 [Ridgeia piscesae]